MPLIQWLLNLGWSVSHVYVLQSGITLGGSSDTNVPVSLDFPVNWDINSSVDSTVTFNWNIGTGTLFYYQVLGECLTPTCQNSGVSQPNCHGKQQFLQIVTAHNLAEVCEQLQQQMLTYPMIWPIKSIEQQTRPVYLPVTAQDSSLCNTLTNQDYRKVPECLIFTLRDQANVNMGMSVTIQDNFWVYTASGGLAASGGVVSNDIDVPTPSGGITMGGQGLYHSVGASYTYTISGGVTMGLGASVISPVWQYTWSGDIIMETTPIVANSTSWTTHGSGGITLGGSTQVNEISYDFVPTAGITLGASADVTVTGMTFPYIGIGPVILSGTIHAVSSAWAYTASGGAVTSGSYNNIYLYAMSGGMNSGGTASLHYGLTYSVSGGITIQGSNTFVSPTWNYIPTGGIAMGGTSIAKSSYKGLFVVNMVASMSLLDMEATFAIQNLSNLTPLVPADQQFITVCDCRPIPVVLSMAHNLLDNNSGLTDFLGLNGYVLPSTIPLRHSSMDGIWRNSFTFTGTGVNGTQERWKLLFEWGCDTDATNTIQMKLSMFFSRKDLTLNESSDTRILYSFSPDPVCSIQNYNISISINTSLQTIQLPARMSLEQAVWKDGVGLFRTADWLQSPNLTINITEAEKQVTATEANISGMLPGTPVILQSLFGG